MGRASDRRRVTRVRAGVATAVRPDTVVGEEPLEIRVGGRSLAVTMRTPGDDMDLALGFLLGEGLIATGADVAAMRYCVSRQDVSRPAGLGLTAAGRNGNGSGDGAVDEDGRPTYNVLDVTLAPGVPAPDVDAARTFYTSSSCGLCGKASIDAVRVRGRYEVADDPLRVAPDVVTGLPPALRAAQRLFDTTGGLHAAGLAGADGVPWVVREDVGRHNAVDKVVGAAARAGRIPLTGQILVVSGRASFELVQKALLAGVPMLAAVSAPSTLAVDLAEEAGMTLAGFVRGDTMNLYSGAHRIACR
ncbi:formate dehydrogenase accessory sulfurtransferase FdhD [Frankia sp. R82]|uniref:formate dehydrogenase accessory sulfurtransferase FdhD n=1 Tax=Frankia sp. R82 TaxID=2950553 RepID=UPI00204333AC|nr:formate dehydrogenase accessory sulfurtransferase FdhD [Frankia sp. R82]MCM3883268.1 formate dehydrogenase accessory sulfurtransferase FdhD [Frankia sp. R82]